MNLTETAQLVTLVDTLDPYARAHDEVTQRLRISAWTTLLEDVPLDFALVWAERTFRHPRPRMVEPSEVREAWEVHERVETARARPVDDRLVSVGGAVADLLGDEPRRESSVADPLADWECERAVARFDQEQAKVHAPFRFAHRSRENLAQAVAAYRAGEPIPPPRGSDGREDWTPDGHRRDEAAFERDFPVGTGTAAERRCGTRGCRCPHTSCMGGFMDEDEVMVRKGYPYHSQRRCLACEQAILERQS